MMLEPPPRYVPLEVELKKNPEIKMSDLQILKDWMDKEPHLPNINMVYILFFFYSNYYHLEPTKRTIDNFYTVRTHTPELFANRDPLAWKELRKAFTVTAVVPLKQKTKEGYIMTYARFLDSDPSRYNQNECMKYFFMTCEVQTLTNGTSNGHIIILDATGLSFGHVAQINIPILKKILFYIQEAAPIRLKAIHILNTTSLIDTVLNISKPFLKAEILKLMHFHSDLETVKKFLPIETLPNESGGKAGPTAEIAAKHIELLEEFREWFQREETVGRVNESLRIGKFHNANSLFGIDGSFKKLEID